MKEDPTLRRIMFFDPYFHFIHIWGSFVGFTSKPNRQFTFDQAFLSQDDLAIDALPAPPNGEAGRSSSFAKQGATFMTTYTNCPVLPREDFPEICEVPTYGDSIKYTYRDCVFIKNTGPLTGGPSAMDSVGYLIALSVLYLLMAGVWATMFSYGKGKGGRFFSFLFTKCWRNHSAEYTGVPAERDDNDDDSRSDGVIVDNVQKSYGSSQALRGVSFRMTPGQVTALVGHNGAGKTTLSNILCCETPASGGDIRVFGQSVVGNPAYVRKMVGLCRQDDYLWPDLSAREHLKLFAGLRGVDSRFLEGTVQEWLVSVDLDEVQNQYSSGYSGGMKRRLSVALATIGDPPLIVLDEVGVYR